MVPLPTDCGNQAFGRNGSSFGQHGPREADTEMEIRDAQALKRTVESALEFGRPEEAVPGFDALAEQILARGSGQKQDVAALAGETFDLFGRHRRPGAKDGQGIGRRQSRGPIENKPHVVEKFRIGVPAQQHGFPPSRKFRGDHLPEDPPCEDLGHGIGRRLILQVQGA